MSDKIFANGRAIAGKGTAHMARSLGPTDICKVPPQNIPTPFPNFVMTSKLSSGATTNTMIGGEPIWTAAGKLSPSEPPHPGVGKGLVSGTYRGAAEASTYSPDVIVEGNGVVRLLDMTFQNDRNTVGVVDLSSALAAWLASMEEDAARARAEAGQDGAEAEQAENPDAAIPEDTAACDDDAEEPPPNEEEPKECFLDCATVTDKGGRAAKDGKLEVVAPDTLKCAAEFDGVCPDDAHPKWALSGRGADTKIGKETTFELPSQSLPGEYGATTGEARTFAPGATIGGVFGIKFKKLSTWTPRSYGVNVSAHKGTPQQFTIKSYPDSEFEGEIHLQPLETIKGMLDILKRVVNVKPGINRAGNKDDWEFLVGRIGGMCKWAEHTDHRVYFHFTISLGYKPLIEAWVKWFIPIPVIGVIQTAIRKFRLGQLDLFLRVKGAIELVGSFGRTRPGGVGGDISLQGKLTLDVGIEAAILEDVLRAEAFGSSGITGEAKARFGGGAYLDLKLDWDGLSVSLKVTTTVWWLTFLETDTKIPLVEPRLIWEKKPPIKLMP